MTTNKTVANAVAAKNPAPSDQDALKGHRRGCATIAKKLLKTLDELEKAAELPGLLKEQPDPWKRQMNDVLGIRMSLTGLANAT